MFVPGRKVLLLMLLCAPLLSACKQELYANLSQREANEMIAVLHAAQISAERTADGEMFTVLVPEGDFGRSVELLSARGMPKQSYSSIDKIFPGDRMILTPFEQKIRMKYAIDQELSKAISSIEGVIDANVLVVLPDVDFRGKPITKTTASVLVKSSPNADMLTVVAQIRTLVANAVPGIEYADVAVVHSDLGNSTDVPILNSDISSQ